MAQSYKNEGAISLLEIAEKEASEIRALSNVTFEEISKVTNLYAEKYGVQTFVYPEWYTDYDEDEEGIDVAPHIIVNGPVYDGCHYDQVSVDL